MKKNYEKTTSYTNFIEMLKKTPNSVQSLKIPKPILLCSTFIASISPKLATLLASKLFMMPMKHKLPKREWEMDAKSKQQLIKIPVINKKVILYQYGESEKKVLLTHGWSGRGTQLFKIADELLKLGYATVSFDAPAHGKSPGRTTIMSEFVETILEIEKQYGPFEAAVGHSLGAMSLLNAVKKGLVLNQLVLIGSGDVVQDILDNFIAQLELKPIFSQYLRSYFEKKYGIEMDSFSAYRSANGLTMPVLVIHDKDDYEVPVTAGIHIHQNLKNGTLFLTEGLGHRKILGNSAVIEKVARFLAHK